MSVTRRRWAKGARALFIITLAVAVAGSLIPIGGTDVGLDEVDVSCGPALSTVAGWTEPAADGVNDMIRVGADFGYTAKAWCQGEAGKWLRPSYGVAAVLGLLALASSIVARLSSRTTRLQAPIPP